MATNDSNNSFNPTESSSAETKRFDKSLEKDTTDYHVQQTDWSYARNAINNSNIGDLGRLGNEPANKFCIKVEHKDSNGNVYPLTIIGFIHLEHDKWVIFSTDNFYSEIGYFIEEQCLYYRIVNDVCLNFSTNHLIYGQARETFDCTHTIYWSDGLNPDRYMSIGDIDYAPYADPWPGVPYFCIDQNPVPACSLNPTPSPNPCYTCQAVFPLRLVCDKLRLESFMIPICLNVNKGEDGGELLNGSYFVLAAYSVNGLRVTDYSSPSNVQPLFSHAGIGGSIRIQVCAIDKENFDQFELVVVSVIAQQTVAKIFGTYSTNQEEITIDIIDKSLPTVPIEQLPVRNVIYDKSDAMFKVNDYLIRVAPTGKFQFNYQPLANQIRTKWVSVEYPEEYYKNGGNNVGYMRDEVYSFFIRWIYKTGDKSASFHIPGRPFINDPVWDNRAVGAADPDVIEVGQGFSIADVKSWMVYNTAPSVSPYLTVRNTTAACPYVLCDGGVVIAEGYMGYWESSERYPDDKPEIWNASAHTWSCLNPPGQCQVQKPYPLTVNFDYDLCGKAIRHHKFPDNDLHPAVSHFRSLNCRGSGNNADQFYPSAVNSCITPNPPPISDPSLNHIRVMGVQFENIRPPVDNDGNLIPEIAGYEILRGSRVGAKSVIAKGIINNMGEFNIDTNNDNNVTNAPGLVKGLYQNYPYNDVQLNGYLSKTKTTTSSLSVSNPGTFEPLDVFKQNIFSFHSPETNFSDPYLSSTELKVYQDLCGTVNMYHKYVDGHPKTIIVKDVAVLIALLAGFVTALVSTSGKRSQQKSGYTNISNFTGPKIEWKNDVNYNLTAQVYGSTGSLNQTNTYDNTDVHPLANDAVTDARAQNLSFMAAAFGLSSTSTDLIVQAGLAGTGYSKRIATDYSNSLSRLYQRMYRQNMVIHKKTGIGFTPVDMFDWGASDYLPATLYNLPLATGLGQNQFIYYLTEGAELAWRAIFAWSTPRQHELQTLSHCHYSGWAKRPASQRRRSISYQTYIDNQIHQFTKNYRINNLYRGRFVGLLLTNDLNYPFNSLSFDNSRVNTEAGNDPALLGNPERWTTFEVPFLRNSSTYYTAIKQRIRNQYGQLPNIKQIPISCNLDYCYQGFSNRTLQYPDGYNLRGLSPLSTCLNNIVQQPDFPNNSIDNASGFWISSPVGYWQDTQVGATDVAKNNGGTVLTPANSPNSTGVLYQVLQPAGTFIPSGGTVTNFSFDIIEMPQDSAYVLTAYLGSPSSGITLATIDGAAVPSLPYNIQVTNIPVIGSPQNRVTFELEVPLLSTTQIADIVGRPPFEGRGICAYTWYQLYFDNVSGNTNGAEIQDDSTVFLVENPGGNSTANPPIPPVPNIYSSSVQDATVTNYISDVSCPTYVTWDFGIRYLWWPCFCDNITRNRPGCRALWGGSVPYPYIAPYAGIPGYPPAPCQTSGFSYFNGKPRSIYVAAYGPTQNTSGPLVTVPTSINIAPAGQPPYLVGLAECFGKGNFTITLRRIMPGQPAGNAGVLITTVVNINNITNATAYIAQQITGSYTLDAGTITAACAAAGIPTGPGSGFDPYDSDARFYFLIETSNGINHQIDTGEISISACYAQEPVSITNVCLEANTISGTPGCTDSSAVNFVPLATVDDGSCIYCACTTPGYVNYVQQEACPECPGGVRYISCNDPRCTNSPDCPCEEITVDPPSNPNQNNTPYGYCNWSCLKAYEQGSVGQPGCVITVSNKTYPLFGGDTYVGRYTEKNSFFYFRDWLYGQPDRYEYDYLKQRMIPYPTYWYDSAGVSLTETVSSFLSFITNPFAWGSTGWQNVVYPSKYHVLDRPVAQLGLAIKYGYIYLFNSGVRDFYVESEYNVDLRDYGDETGQRHYSPYGKDSYTDLNSMFASQVIKFGNYYKYDNSLSMARIWYSYVNWGSVYPPFYDPSVAETCFQYRPDKLLYSLPVTEESVRDNWRIFLTNNYKDFIGKITAVRQINKSGILILFDSESPLMFQGTDQLQTDLGTKLTIGDGGLFSQPAQSLMNADRPYEYASCQNKLSVINTPAGVFWISQNQGKIFQLSSGLTEISMSNIKWWLAQYLPYRLTAAFPNYPLIDNAVSGIGCQAIYDNTNNLVYFTKKDYRPLKGSNGEYVVRYDGVKNVFKTNSRPSIEVALGDPLYFEDASWTISYDLKTKSWISFHDWHPGLLAPGKNTFMTTKDNGVWIHNRRCDLYTTYYDVPYPFEVEYIINTAQTVNTLRSIEYQLECYSYNVDNCYDRFHVLDHNFDEAVVYNTEQCSGLLKLNLTPKNNAPRLVNYPIFNPTNVQILYSKEENKYRFNQFWDITRDRGEFDWIVNDYNNTIDPINAAISAVPGNLNDTPVSTLPAPGGTPIIPGNYAQQTIWNTESNGYKRTVNPLNLNYQKVQLQKKRFRHYSTTVLLRRKAAQNNKVKMLMSLINNKNLLSPR